MSSFETITLEVGEGIATITLNRPERMNAFNTTMMQELIAALDRTDADDEVRAVIVTGAGERAFCAGADLAAGGNTFDYDRLGGEDRTARNVAGVHRDGGGMVALRIFDSLKPIIGAVNGAAVGVGSTMLLPMDFRLAASNARFGFVFNRRGIAPESASSWFLPRLVGMPAALQWCYSGRLIPAVEALAKSLVQSVHPPAELLPAARALAREFIEDTSPVSVAVTRQLMWRMLGASHPMDAHRYDSRAIQARGAQADAKEGVGAFLEKRPARFPNKVSTDLPDIWDGWSAPNF